MPKMLVTYGKGMHTLCLYAQGCMTQCWLIEHHNAIQTMPPILIAFLSMRRTFSL